MALNGACCRPDVRRSGPFLPAGAYCVSKNATKIKIGRTIPPTMAIQTKYGFSIASPNTSLAAPSITTIIKTIRFSIRASGLIAIPPAKKDPRHRV